MSKYCYNSPACDEDCCRCEKYDIERTAELNNELIETYKPKNETLEKILVFTILTIIISGFLFGDKIINLLTK